MLFVPTTAASLWDVWLYQESGTHYLFYLASTRTDRPWDAIGVATSTDGVHFDDRGLVIHKASDAEYLGAGHTWKAGGRYVFNFSECRNGNLSIFFAESDDLLNWRRIPAARSECRLDPRWYAVGTAVSDQRWDNIWVLPSEDGDGYFGYVTAVAKDGPEGLRGTAASVRSTDGISFAAGPPVIEPGVWGDKLEIGAVERIGGQYYMLASQAEIPLGLRWTAHHGQAAGGVHVLRADRQTGPFTLDPAQPPILVSAPEHYTYFARFYRTDAELLACHHAIAPVRDIVSVMPKAGTAFAPLKAVRCDDGVLSLAWWPGNQALAGEQLPVGLADLAGHNLGEKPAVDLDVLRIEAPAGGLAALPIRYDLAKGVVVEAELTLERVDGQLAGVGLFIEGMRTWDGTVMLLDTAGRFSIGRYHNRYAFKAEDVKPGPADVGRATRWRLLIRGPFVEAYLNDLLVQCYTLPDPVGGRLGFVVESGQARVADISVAEMTL